MPAFLAVNALIAAGMTTGQAILTAVTATVMQAVVIGGPIIYSADRQRKARHKLQDAMNAGRTTMVRTAAEPQELVYGQVLKSGVFYPIAESGTNREYIYFALIVAGHEVEELGTVYFNDESVPLDGSGNATGTYAGYARVKKFLGLAAGERDMDWESEIPSYWTSNHLGKGIARLHIRLKWSAEKFPTGIPNVKVMVKGKKVYNPVTETTAWSDNAALCAADYLMDAKFGRAVAQARIVAADWQEAVNICAESVELADTSTEDRYTCNGVVSAATAPSETIRLLAGAMAGRIIDTGGTWTIRAGAWRTPESLTLTDSDLIGPISVQARQSRQDTFNRVRGTYFSPENNWALTDAPAISNSTYKAKDGDIWLDLDMEFPFTTSSATVQRLEKIELEQGRQQTTFTGLYSLKALGLMPGDVVPVTREKLGWNAKPFEVLEWTFKRVGDEPESPLGILITARETAEGIWDWNDGEETTVDLAPNTDLPDPLIVATPTGLTLSADSVRQPDGVYAPRLKVVWNAATDQYVLSGGKVRVEYKRNSSSDWIVWSEQRGDATVDYITDAVFAVSYDVRIQFENTLGVRGAYASSLNFILPTDNTAPAAPTGLAAVVGTGKAISLDWSDNTESDLAEYRVYRNTTNNAGTATLIAEVAASRFVDVDVTIGTTYYYWVSAVDTFENESTKSSGVNATPTTIPEAALDPDLLADVAQAIQDAADAQGTADGKVTTFVQASPPTAEGVGDLWIDSDDANKLYRWNGSSWAAIRDTGIAQALADAADAQATADGKIVTFYQTSSPTAKAVGDLWVDTDDGNCLYRWSGSSWVSVRDAGIATAQATASQAIADAADAQATADGKVTTFVQASAPTAEGVGDLWVDTDDSNKLYRWSGSAWVLIRDTGISTAITNAANAQATADGKIVTFYQTSAPTASAVGDLWVDTDDGNRLYRWSGSSWVDVQGIRSTAPANPSAPTKNTDGTYVSGDGTVYARLVINVPSMPSGAAWMNILYRRNGTAGWIVADQRNSGGGTTSIDDLSPGVQYEVAAQAFSNFGIGSGIVSATGSPFTAPNKGTGPSAPSSGALSNEGVRPAFLPGTQVFLYGTRVTWAYPADADFAFFEVKATATNSDSATDYTWFADGSGDIARTYERVIFLHAALTFAGHVRVRARNRSGIASAWTYVGSINSSNYSRGIGTVAQYNSNAVEVTGIQTGNGASVRKVLARYQFNGTLTITATGASQKVKVDLTGRGFSTKPDVAAGPPTASDDNNILWRYDWDDTNNNSTAAYVEIFKRNGANVTNGEFHRFTIEFIEYDT